MSNPPSLLSSLSSITISSNLTVWHLGSFELEYHIELIVHICQVKMRSWLDRLL